MSGTLPASIYASGDPLNDDIDLDEPALTAIADAILDGDAIDWNRVQSNGSTDPNLARQQQIFQIWVRPVEPENGVFALRAVLYEYDKLVRDGMSREAFDATREFLGKYANILTQTYDARLGYALDSRYYGIADYNTYLRDALSKLTLDDVNRAVRQHLKTDLMRIVIVTKNAQVFRDAVVTNEPSPIAYNSPKPAALMDEDKVIQAYRLNVRPEDVIVVPVERVFE